MRGFQIVDKTHRKHLGAIIELPVRADKGSAGYDLKTPVDLVIEPGKSVLVWTDIKAYMLTDEVLQVYIRSSIAIKLGLTLRNTVGIIDASYYANVDNDGNIGVCLRNDTDKQVTLNAGDRIAQGIFMKYLVTDNDITLNNVRSGGIGSSGR